MTIKDCLKKDILFSVNLARFDGHVQEGTVETLSPSGRYVCIGYSWYDVNQVNVLEVFPDKATSVAATARSGAPASEPAAAVQTSEPARILAPPLIPPIEQTHGTEAPKAGA